MRKIPPWIAHFAQTSMAPPYTTAGSYAIPTSRDNGAGQNRNELSAVGGIIPERGMRKTGGFFLFFYKFLLF